MVTFISRTSQNFDSGSPGDAGGQHHRRDLKHRLVSPFDSRPVSQLDPQRQSGINLKTSGSYRKFWKSNQPGKRSQIQRGQGRATPSAQEIPRPVRGSWPARTRATALPLGDHVATTKGEKGICTCSPCCSTSASSGQESQRQSRSPVHSVLLAPRADHCSVSQRASHTRWRMSGEKAATGAAEHLCTKRLATTCGFIP